MPLIELPIECLTQIIEDTIPEGFESFAIACKILYHTGEKFRDMHNRLRRQYRNFKYTKTNECLGDNTSSLQLLLRIADNPLIARYINHANFTHDDICGNVPTVDDFYRLNSCPSLVSLLKRSAYLHHTQYEVTKSLEQTTPHVVPEAVIEAWKINPSLISSFLLTLLPNVTTLCLPADIDDFESHLMNTIIDRANDPLSTAAGLSKLHTILPSAGWRHENRKKLSTFSPFLSIRSVKRLCAGSCRAIDDGYTGAAFPTPVHASFGAELEVVELAGAVFDAKELRKFLSRLHTLRVLKLNYETKWHGCGLDMNAREVMEVIEDEAGGTLEVLSVTVLECFGSMLDSVKSMKKFSKLRDLELDIRLLLSPGDNPWKNSLQTQGSDNEAPKLVDLLPPTVETLCLMVKNLGRAENALNMLLVGTAVQKDEKLPRLEKITLRTSSLAEPGILHRKFHSYASRQETFSGDGTDPLWGLEWHGEMAQLAKSVDVKFVHELTERGSLLPLFMEDFSLKYDVGIL